MQSIVKKILLCVSAIVVALLLSGCGQNLSDEEIEARNAKSRAAVEKMSEKSAPDDVKSNGTVLAKKIGASGTVQLPKGYKLLTVTYKGKGDSMWLLYRPMREGETAEVYYFQEDSFWGVVEGTVKIVESVE